MEHLNAGKRKTLTSWKIESAPEQYQCIHKGREGWNKILLKFYAKVLEIKHQKEQSVISGGRGHASQKVVAALKHSAGNAFHVISISCQLNTYVYEVAYISQVVLERVSYYNYIFLNILFGGRHFFRLHHHFRLPLVDQLGLFFFCFFEVSRCMLMLKLQ